MRCTLQRFYCKSRLRINRVFYGAQSGTNNHISVLRWEGLTYLSDDGDRVSKDDLVFIPIRLLNRSPEVWGEDANEFRYVQVLPLIIRDARRCTRPDH
jgi:hypothetical protein